MSDLINGRTPEEIKNWMRCCSVMTSCYNCPYNRNDYCVSEAVLPNALAYIQHLEAQQPKWISVKERFPEYKTAVLGYGLRSKKYSETDKFPAAHVVYTRGEDEGWFTFWNNEYVAVTHWMPLPQPPEEE